MAEGNEDLRSLDSAFYEIYVRPRPSLGIREPHIVNFSEMRPERFRKWSLGPVSPLRISLQALVRTRVGVLTIESTRL